MKWLKRARCHAKWETRAELHDFSFEAVMVYGLSSSFEGVEAGHVMWCKATWAILPREFPLSALPAGLSFQ